MVTGTSIGSPPRPWGPRRPLADSRDDYGSPPRPWGPREASGCEAKDFRFTPTPVGTTTAISRRMTMIAVHPHARGDHHDMNAKAYNPIGSPPRPWGPRRRGSSRMNTRRFTPTPVGTTRGWRSRSPCHPVHPHARGDHAAIHAGAATPLGSPPRPWGPRMTAAALGHRRRFTPTPVGTTPRRSAHRHHLPVHPHARGDHRDSPSDRYSPRGSPPRPWGPRRRCHQRARRRRFTPTPVGTTRDAVISDHPEAVHPHARGDHDSC